MTEEQIKRLNSVSNTLVGMNFDLRIPQDARKVLLDLSVEIEELTGEFTD